MMTLSSGKGDAGPFESLEEMRAAYNGLVRGYGEMRGGEPPADFLRRLNQFIARGRETGTLLDDPRDRLDAQSMLNFWATILYRYRQTPEDEPAVTTLLAFGSSRPDGAAASSAPFLAPPESGEYVGRAGFLADLKQQLGTRTAIALYGPLGAGVTGVAAKLAHELRETFPDGVLWASLGERPDVTAALAAWGEALNLQGRDENRFTDLEHKKKVIRRALARRRTLIVIDDVWQAEAALELKLGGPFCAHVVTTYLMQIALSFDTDGTVAVPGLIPSDGLELFARYVPEATLAQEGEARLLIEELDGSPLGLSLLAKYHKFGLAGGQLDFKEMREQLAAIKTCIGPPEPPLSPTAQPFKAPVPPSLLASITWCYEHLLDDERKVLQAFARFPAKPNSFPEDAARQITDDDRGVLERLIDYGLVERYGHGRYTLHRAIADYLKRAAARNTEAEQGRRLVDFYVSVAREHAADLDVLQREEQNILAALETAWNGRMWRQLIEVVGSLLDYFDHRGLFALAKEWLGRALEAARELADRKGQGEVLLNLGHMEERLSEYADAAEHLEAALTIARELDDRGSIARALQELGVVAMAQMNYPVAEQHLKDALEEANNLGDTARECALYTRLGWMQRGMGNFDKAKEYSLKGLELARANEDAEQTGELLLSLGVIAYLEGDYSRAVTLDLEGLDYAEKAHDSRLRCGLLQALGGAEICLGEFEKAEAHLLESQRLAREIGHRWYGSVIWKEFGELRLRQEYMNAASESFTKALELAREVNSPELIGLALYGLARTAAARKNFAEARLQGLTCLDIFKATGHQKEWEVQGWLNTLS